MLFFLTFESMIIECVCDGLIEAETTDDWNMQRTLYLYAKLLTQNLRQRTRCTAWVEWEKHSLQGFSTGIPGNTGVPLVSYELVALNFLCFSGLRYQLG